VVVHISILILIFGLTVSIVFLIICILFFKNKALVLIPGYKKDEFTERQSRLIAKASGRFMLTTGISIGSYPILKFTIDDTKTLNFVFTVLVINTIVTLIIYIYQLNVLKKM
jgi:Domain of unknown function (DUF3784)